MRRPLREVPLLCAIMAMMSALTACHSLLNSNPPGFDTAGGESLPTVMHPSVTKQQSMMALASDLDHLEKHIDWYGSVTAKTPDVWGQARLTQYREQFEHEMAGEMSQFKFNLHGSIARSDQAYFASAMALSAAVQPRAPLIGVVRNQQAATLAPVSRETIIKDTVEVSSQSKASSGDQSNSNTKDTTTTTKEEPPKKVEPLDLTDPDTMIDKSEAALKRNELVKGSKYGFGQHEKTEVIGIEPTLYLAQKKRYLDFLNQLRRENEGDDVADSPGYSLNLIRVPVSVLPGKRTDAGHGAEVTVTLNPVLGDELLPATFRKFVINDLVDQIGFALTLFLDEERERADNKKMLTEDVHSFLQYRQAIVAQHTSKRNQRNDPTLMQSNAIVPIVEAEPTKKDTSTLPPPGSQPPELRHVESLRLERGARILGYTDVTAARVAIAASNGADSIPPNLRSATSVRPSLSFSNGINARSAFPTSQMLNVYGTRYSFEIAFGAQQALRREITRTNIVHLPDVQSFLREEIQAAYRFLAEPVNQCLWSEYCTPEIVELVHSQRWIDLQERRRSYQEQVRILTRSQTPTLECELDEHGKIVQKPTDPDKTRQYSRISALAWAILVDSALLTNRLIKDMKEIASAKNAHLPHANHWLPYYSPTPPPEARQAFNEYVKVRWPIRVFALDPMTQDQNLADQLSTRRETQLALSIAFTNGQLSSRSFTRYARRLEAEYETVALNRTQVGFGHGENTFGWRFYPRFQTPDTRGNLEVFARDQLIGGPSFDQLLKQRRLEPGPRECVAIVMMPSFVPYMEMDTVSNWFPLTNPKQKVLDHSQAMRLSRSVQAIHTDGRGVKDAHQFRDGDFTRLHRRASQLEARLPLQTLQAAVPILNTLGGFEMFANGTTDLAPELHGWYGAPGVNATGQTTLFLVGDHFSPLHTYVIVGNQEIAKDKRKMLSRQVMQVTITNAPIPVAANDRVRIHVATPYGVTRELEVPVIRPKTTTAPVAPAEGYTIKTPNLRIPVCLRPVEKKFGLEFDPRREVEPKKLSITWFDKLGTAPPKIKVRFVFAYKNQTHVLPGDAILALGSAGTFTIETADLRRLADSIFALVNADSPVDASNLKLSDFEKTIRVEIMPTDGAVPNGPPSAHVFQGVQTLNQLELEFVAEEGCPPAVKEKAPPKPVGPALGPSPSTPVPPIPKGTIDPEVKPAAFLKKPVPE